MLICTSKILISFFSNALDVMLQNQHYSFLKPHSNLVLIECNTETGWWSHWSVNLLKLRYQRPSWGRVLKDQLLRFRATFINTIRHCDVIKAGNHGNRSRYSLSYYTFLTSQEPLEIQLIITLPLQCWLHILHSTVWYRPAPADLFHHSHTKVSDNKKNLRSL